MKICQALRIDKNSRIAWVGAGGKTTGMFRAAEQLAGPVLISATAHLAIEQTYLADRHFIVTSLSELSQIEPQLLDGINLITGPETIRDRVQGLCEGLIAGVRDIADKRGMPLLVEADGARMRPLKAPAEHEPPIPPWVNSVIVVAGLAALDQPLDDQWVFRPEIFSELTGLKQGDNIKFANLCMYLCHPRGGLKNIPDNAEKIVLLNQRDIKQVNCEEYPSLLKSLLGNYISILFSTMNNTGNEVVSRCENIAAIVLAAGASARFGKPKQLLDWKGKPFIVHVVETALKAGCNPVAVVLGAVIDPIIEALKEYPVEIIINPGWEEGQASSIRQGIKAVQSRCRGAIFFVSDMPQVSRLLIHQYLEYHKENNYHILVPRVNSRPTNPAMFDCRCFDALAEVQGKAGGRQIFNRFPVSWKDVDDPLLALDMDTPEDYQRFLELTDG